MRIFIKSIKLLLVFSMLFVFTGIGAFAKENNSSQLVIGDETLTIVKDNAVERVVKSKDTVATFNKKTNVLTMKVAGKDPVVIDLTEELLQTTPITTSFSSTTGENTFSNYEYDIDQTHNPNYWELRRPDPNNFNSTLFIRTHYNSTIGSDLYNFRDAVEDINMLEWEFIGLSLGVGLAAAITVILTAIHIGGSIAVGLVALGLTGEALQTGVELGERSEDAHYYYFEVKYAI